MDWFSSQKGNTPGRDIVVAWKNKPTNYATKIIDSIGETQAKTTVDLVTNLTRNTPVDTGRARANWIVKIGKPSRSIKEITSKSGNVAIAQAENVAGKIARGDGNSIVFVSNNLPYIVHLDKGTDKMAPFNIVQKSIKATARRVRWEI